MTPDPAARRLYFLRTNQPCPQCGQTGNGAAGGTLCPECGRHLPEQEGMPGDKGAVLAELDELIDAVDEIVSARVIPNEGDSPQYR